MPSTPQSVTGKRQDTLKGSQDTLEHSKMRGEEMKKEGVELSPLSSDTTQIVNISTLSTVTSNPLDYPSLRLQASLISGSLGAFKAIPGARVKCETVTLTQPSGKKYYAIRIFIAVDNADVEVVDTEDGIDFAVAGKRLEVVDDEKE